MLILISRFETWISQKVAEISPWNNHHSITLSKSFPMIPNTWQFGPPEDYFFLQKIEIFSKNIYGNYGDNFTIYGNP